MAVGFGQAVDLRDIKAECFNTGQCGRGRGGTGGEYFDLMVKAAAVFWFCIDNKIKHDGRPAKMRDPLVGNGAITRLGADIAAAHDCATKDGHHPSVVPAVTVE